MAPITEQEISDNIQAHYKNDIKKKRYNCTDILCLLLFLIFLGIQVALSAIIYINGGDPRNLIYPHDSNGNLCTGSSPNLFYFNLVECIGVSALVTGCSSPTKCIASCPTDNYYYEIDSHRDILYSNYCIQSSLLAYYNNQVPTSTPNAATYFNLAKAQICPLYTITSQSFYGRCLPNILVSAINAAQAFVVNDNSTNTNYTVSDLNQQLNYNLLAEGAKYISSWLNIKGIAQFVLEDFLNSVYIIIVLLLIAALVSFIYIIILRWVLGPFLFVSIIGVIAGLGFSTYYCINKYIVLNRSETSQTFQFKLDFNYYLTLSVTWLVFGIICGVLLLIILLLMLVLVKRIRLAIQLIREASKAIGSMFITLFFPLFPLLLQMGVLAYFIITAVILASSGKAIFRVANSKNFTNLTNSSVKLGDTCDPNKLLNVNGAVCIFYNFGTDATQVYSSIINWLYNYQFVPQLYNLFMFFWFQSFIVGFNQMVLAGSFGTWYWSKSRARCSLFVSIKDTFIYHLGSVAFGSLMIAICKFLRTIIQMAERRIKKATGNNGQLNCIIKAVACFCKCWIWCLERFLKFINRNAYIMVAIYGRNFCTSARDAVTLLAMNPLRALVLDRVTDFVLFLGRLLITAGVGVLGFYFFSKEFYINPAYRKYFAPDLHYYWVPLIVVIISTYAITKTFFTVFEMAVDTIFLCAMKDLDINDGTEQKPYAMSAKLLKLLNVKNERQANANVNDPRFHAVEAKNK